jgi:hypothetical protein
MNYEHTQKSPLGAILLIVAVVIFAVGWVTAADEPTRIVVAAAAISLALAGMCFGALTVRDEGDRLVARFGPLPAFRTSVRYSDITSVEPDRTSFIDGWGMHYLPGRGSIYNVWGFHCVKLQVGKRVVRIGTDDVDGLVSFLREKTGKQESHA